MVISRQDLQKQLIPALHDVIGLSYKRLPDQYTKIFTEYKTDRSFEEEVLMTGFGEAPLKSEGAGVSFDDASEAWTQRYIMDTIAMAFAITEEAMEDEQYDTYSRLRGDALGYSMKSTKEQRGADILNNGFTGGAYALGDGQALYSATHPLVNGGNLDNADTADLSEAALESALIAIAAYTDDRGILVNCQANRLIIPSNLQFTAFEILKSDLSTTTATVSGGVTNVNNVNALKGMGFFPGGVHVNNRLTDTDAWHIITDCPNGFKYWNRIPLQITQEGDFTTGNLRIKARERYTFGVMDPRAAYGSDGSAG